MVLAVVRVRGRRNVNPKIRKTLELLNLKRVNYCTLVRDDSYFRGMLQVVKDYVTFGPIDDDTLRLLVEKRGRKGRKRLNLSEEGLAALIEEIKQYGTCSRKMREKINPVFRLKPPTRGYKDIKKHYPWGALGPRPEMDSLLRRMI